ncbi:hypothetical protein MC378_13400 [Polaribacter sp. MSW13]|uniref:TonB C-terminal domain-containing protein n=1 Tax=Polaribacter marinus TaxID=2916838 RepID=A0A9X1VQU9_9FLAO|nr:hypothetical protein [Polaribacter marinus]MCI2230168.1 hypothetical protein [Polaribacter marinus]
MFLRVFTFIIVIVFFTSCDKFSFTNNSQTITLDTIVDLSSVDVSPSFKVCDSIIDKTKKTDCFRTSIHQKIGGELLKHSFIIKNAISETVYVNMMINSKGLIILEEVQSSENIKKELPELDSLLRACVQKLPIIHPAIKRGIPVTTKYRLPIKIQLTE